jgi:hypothetical protein
MNHPHDDAHVGRLQRLAYGADSTPEERRRAADELKALAAGTPVNASPSPGPGDADSDGGGPPSTRAQAAAAAAAAAPGDSPEPDDQPRLARRLVIRIGVAAGAAALVLGVMAGWQLGQLGGADAADAGAPAVPPASPGPLLQADVLAAMPVAAETPAARVFLRDAVAEDTPDLPGVADGIGMTPTGGPLEFRLLATRSDGTRYFAARDGADLCLFITFPAEPESLIATAGCTQSGRFPNEGVRVTGSGGQHSVDATWRPDGSLEIGMLSGAPG